MIMIQIKGYVVSLEFYLYIVYFLLIKKYYNFIHQFKSVNINFLEKFNRNF
jgi:hypothetical protein